jgi:hypothetical protein
VFGDFIFSVKGNQLNADGKGRNDKHGYYNNNNVRVAGDQ